jgi:YD repeat-containing protein
MKTQRFIRHFNQTKETPFLNLTLVLLLLLIPSLVLAQSTVPTGRTPGSPAGSYQLSGFDTVNLFSGNLNFNLPLLKVGGRGETHNGLSLTLETQWDVEGWEVPNGYYQYAFYPKTPSPLSLVGSIRAESSVTTDFQNPCDDNPVSYWVHHQFNFIYVEPDGTEQVLIDRNYHGRPHAFCAQNTVNYGRIFEATDGSFITFVSDADIWTTDNAITGYLMFKNGAKTRVVNGQIMWAQDRNGNKIEYTYEASPYYRLTKIKDSIGREVNIEYGVNESSPYGLCDRIIYKGFGGQDKIIRISRDSLHNVLRTTQPSDSSTVKTIGELFPDYPNDSIIISNPNSIYDPDNSIKAVWLPDGRSYKFKYNVYGRLARVEIPTGGAVEYDFEPSDLPDGGNYEYVVNRVKEKRIYDGNNNLANKTVFTKTVTAVGFPAGSSGTVVDVEQFDSSGSRLAKSRHFFNGTAGGSYGFTIPFWHGREFKTEAIDTDGTTLLRRVEMTWQQRIPSWCYSTLPGNNFPCGGNPPQTAQSINPFIIETKNTIVDGNLVTKVSAVNPTTGDWAFDSYNNQTDVWHYDYGSGQAGNLLKHTQMSYINQTNPLGGIHLLGLTNTTSVYSVNSSGQETLASSVQIVYDEYSQYSLLTYGTVTGWQDPGNIRGNPTTVKLWLNTNNSWVETHAQFDQLGNVRKSWDAKGNVSEIEYWSYNNTYAFPTTATSAIPDPTGQKGSNLAFVATKTFDFSSGLVISATDANGQTTTVEYNDALDRPTKVNRPTGGGWTSFEYGDAVGNLYLKTQTALSATQAVTAYQ